jgi:hypothetical protein
VDLHAASGVDQVVDLCAFPWPWADGSVAEVHSSHFVEHIPGRLRGRWFDELYRVLAVGARATLITPYHASMRAAQDFTHEWPPICEASYLYFNRSWREMNRLTHGAYDLACDFDFTYGYQVNGLWAGRNEEARAFALQHYLHVVDDLHVVLTKRGPNA